MHVMLLQIQLCFGIYYIGLLACRCTGMPPLYQNGDFTKWHSGKSATIRESNQGSGVCKEHVPKSSILLAGTGVWKISSVACGFRSMKIYYFLIIRKVLSAE